MATADQIRALLKSHSEGDEERFYSVALQVAASEARKGHADLAAELREMIDRAKARAGTQTPGSVTIPLAAPRGELAELLAVSYPTTRLADMILGAELRARLDGLITKYMGETSAKLRLVFDAMERTRAVYLFDEFDSIGTDRGHGSDVGEIRRVLNSFLAFIEQYSGTSLVVAATNHGHALDTALFRRFDDLLEFQLPDKALLRATMQRRLATSPARVRVDFDQAIEEAKGMSFGEVVKACDEALKDGLLRGHTELRTSALVRAIRERQGFLGRRE